MYNNIIQYLKRSYIFDSYLKHLNLAEYEDNDVYFKIQNVVKNIKSIEIKNHIFGFSCFDYSDVGKKDYSRINIINTDTDSMNLKELNAFIHSIPHYKLTLFDGTVCITLCQPYCMSTSVLNIYFDNILLYRSDGTREEYYLDTESELFDFMDNIEVECQRRLLNIKGINIQDLISELKGKQEELLKERKNRVLEEKIYNYLH